MTGSSRKKPRARSKRHVPITEEFAADICELILKWRGPITWERIVEEAERVCGHKWTRQGFNNHEDIKKAYKDKTKALKNRASVPDGDIATLLLLEKGERQEVEIQRLKQRVNAYDELFILYQANAHRLGIYPAELERPLPPVERRRGQRTKSDGKHEHDISLVHPAIPSE